MALKTVPFDAALYLRDPKAQAELLDDALRSGDASYVGEALAIIVRARGLPIAGDAADHPESHHSPQPDDDPRLSTLLDLARDLGVRLHIQAVAIE